jgi:mannose-6-phosphate isomerase-like protein (cupin superfamily)
VDEVDKPWGYEQQVLATQIDLPTKMPFQHGAFTGTAILSIRHLFINSEEMTSYCYHETQNDILYIEEGRVVLRTEDSMEDLGQGKARIVRSGEKHQVQNINDKVAKILEISFPYKPDDINRIEDPYRGER